MRPTLTLLAFLFAGVVLTSCEKDPPPPPKYVEYLPAEGDHELGQVLFYDKQLSINNSISCASCHKQHLAFADDVAFSKGFDNQLTERNSMPIQNLGSGLKEGRSSLTFFGPSHLFWDGRELILTEMVLKPIVNHVEMGIDDLDGLCRKLESISYYPELFEKTFGDRKIDKQRIAAALESFIGKMRSDNTRFDRHQFGTEKFTDLEKAGQRLFIDTYNCNDCHQVGIPNGYTMAGTFANIGLDQFDIDAGRGGVTKNPEDVGRFKIPSLRNVALTAPYMHDGRYRTLEDVIDHYTRRIADNKNLDERLRNPDGSILSQPISDFEKKAIIAFLHTLTDESMITNKELSNPFKIKTI